MLDLRYLYFLLSFITVLKLEIFSIQEKIEHSEVCTFFCTTTFITGLIEYFFLNVIYINTLCLRFKFCILSLICSCLNYSNTMCKSVKTKLNSPVTNLWVCTVVVRHKIGNPEA
jgi:hypothetical protein